MRDSIINQNYHSLQEQEQPPVRTQEFPPPMPQQTEEAPGLIDDDDWFTPIPIPPGTVDENYSPVMTTDGEVI